MVLGNTCSAWNFLPPLLLLLVSNLLQTYTLCRKPPITPEPDPSPSVTKYCGSILRWDPAGIFP